MERMLWIALWYLLTLSVTGAHKLTPENKIAIVEIHNRFRSHVVPNATNMRRVHWNESLAAIAQAYITQCVWDHNPDHQNIGENMQAASGPLNVSKAITSWYLEHKNYNYENNSCLEDKMCEHYTQVVWANTYSVGCSVQLCDKVQGLPYNNINLFICNYYPGGNVNKQLPYEAGPPCSHCPATMPVCRNNTCEAEKATTSTRQTSTSPPASSTTSAKSPSSKTSTTTTSSQAQSTFLSPHNPAGADKDHGAAVVTGWALILLSTSLLLLLTA